MRKGLRLLEPWELTPTRFEYLYVLAFSAFDLEKDEPDVCRPPQVMTQKELQGILDLAPQTVSEMLEVLEANGHIERGPRGKRKEGDPPSDLVVKDRRQRGVRITQKGLELVMSVLRANLGRQIDYDLTYAFADPRFEETRMSQFNGKAGKELREFTGVLERVTAANGDWAGIWWYRKYLEAPDVGQPSRAVAPFYHYDWRRVRMR